MWSAGCIFWELIHGAVLFDGQNTSAQFLKIISVLGSPSDDDVQDMYPQAPQDVQSVLSDFVTLEVPAISFDELVPGDKIAADLLSKVRRILTIQRPYYINIWYYLDVVFQSRAALVNQW